MYRRLDIRKKMRNYLLISITRDRWKEMRSLIKLNNQS
jgi:hypothetical protein